jgi:hypothetical protein
MATLAFMGEFGYCRDEVERLGFMREEADFNSIDGVEGCKRLESDKIFDLNPALVFES